MISIIDIDGLWVSTIDRNMISISLIIQQSVDTCQLVIVVGVYYLINELHNFPVALSIDILQYREGFPTPLTHWGRDKMDAIS